MRVLALEPYYGGSHQAFLDGWIEHSGHSFTVLGLPPYKWKWRMRHAAVTLSAELQHTLKGDTDFDVLWCSDMLNLAEFLGLAPEPIRRLPRIAYFHENQLTYPVRVERDRDLHFAYSNFTTCVAAHQIWFNSDFHLQEFTAALSNYLGRMPDYQHADFVAQIRAKSSVQYPGIHAVDESSKRTEGPVRIAWVARWEHDKNPEDFFAALRLLKSTGFPFQLIVLGQSFGNVPPIFSKSQEEFADHILHWGYAADRQDYQRLLGLADVAVSTAHHEFFGIGVVEAMAAGAIPLVPDRLAYPEVLSQCELPVPPAKLTYGQSPNELADAIRDIPALLADATIRRKMTDAIGPFYWRMQALKLDSQLTDAVRTCRVER